MRAEPFVEAVKTILDDRRPVGRAMQSVSQTEPGIFDVKSGSDAKSLEGSPYSEW